MNSLLDKNSLVRFILRETSKDEDLEIICWIAEPGANRKEFQSLYETFKLSQRNLLIDRIDVNQEWADFRAKQIKSPVQKIRKLNWKKVAASVTVLLMVGFGSAYLSRVVGEAIYHPAVVLFEAPAGEKSKVVLADQTEVWLNSSSKLEYDAVHPRNIRLEGEAFFDVSKDTRHPFIVELSNGVKIRVLGTQFNVRSYPDEAVFETTLEEGSVELFGDNIARPIRMSPGEQVLIRGSAYQVREVDSQLYSVWRNNELKVRDLSFAELVLRIERWYGVEIDLDPELQDRDFFTMTIKTESIRELFKMMQLTASFEYEINGNQIQLKAN